jgi:hypothetical protein
MTKRHARGFSRSGARALTLALLSHGCGGARSQPIKPAIVSSAAAPLPSSPAATTTSPAAPAVPPTTAPLVAVTDPAALAALEQRGFSLANWLGLTTPGRASNAALVESEAASRTAYLSLVQVLEADLQAVKSADRHAGVEVHKYPHRLFNARWLRAKTAHFELIGVMNRLDRAPFRSGSCGETRLVYRLAYGTELAGTAVRSRLPLTLGIEIDVPVPEGGCSAIARRWMPPKDLRGAELAAWLTSASAPLDAGAAWARPATSHRIVVNLQRVRWPSAVRPDLGGHAEYLLRSFQPDRSHGTYIPAPLENTPRVDLTSNPGLRAELLSWLREPKNLAAIDSGTFALPEKFLARTALSVTPRGLARVQNRPFHRLFRDQDFATVDFSRFERVRSAQGLIRRLDQTSCEGCHETRSVAGFHLLGDDPIDNPSGNSLAGGTSPHLAAELRRRSDLMRALAANQNADFSQPFAERGDYAGYGAHCGLGTDPTFQPWNCDPRLTCRSYDSPAGDTVGQCLPATPRAAGDPCESGPLSPNANPLRDRVARVEREDCRSNAVCNRNSVGFPGGMCTEDCSSLSDSSTCGAIAVLEPFNACVARGRPFAECLQSQVRPAGLRACSADQPCRDDYVCARTERGGACIPPYFVFQLRVDGHP